jgi:hypothetical protein
MKKADEAKHTDTDLSVELAVATPIVTSEAGQLRSAVDGVLHTIPAARRA